jgi:ribonuclease J
LADIHVSGHACQEELKLMQALIRPKFFIPVHGEYKHLKQHGKLAEKMGVDKENIFILDNGSVLELSRDSAKTNGTVTAGKVLVDGLGVGDVGNIVLRDRKHLSQDGLIVIVVTISKETGQVVAGPDIISRGFVYVRESEDLMDEAKLKIKEALAKCEEKQITEWGTIKSQVKDSLKEFIYYKTKRNPMILPIIMEI